jgi:hypothetical protein
LAQNFVLEPIIGLAGGADEGTFDQSVLPFVVVDDVRIENVSPLIRPGTFDHLKEMLGRDVVEKMERVRYGLIFRYGPRTVIDGKMPGDDAEQNTRAEYYMRKIAACLRLVRPMSQSALLMRGTVRYDGTLDVTGSDIPPLHLIEVPEVQKLFHLRNSDCNALRLCVPEFLRGMMGGFWKFRMSLQFHDLGYFQTLDWRARYLLWCSAIESIYTTHHREHQGKRVATSRIKWFLGETTSIYAPGDLTDLLRDPQITVGRIVGDLYDVRNYLAHGDRIPDVFFTEILRNSFNGGVNKMDVLLEAASFIVRSTLLKVLQDRLLDHFTDARSAETYFGPSLTNSALQSAGVP